MDKHQEMVESLLKAFQTKSRKPYATKKAVLRECREFYEEVKNGTCAPHFEETVSTFAYFCAKTDLLPDDAPLKLLVVKIGKLLDKMFPDEAQQRRMI